MNKPSISEIGVFLKKRGLIIFGALGTIFGIVSYFVPLNQNPNLTYFQKSVVNVFSLNDSINDLQIFFKGEDLRKQRLNLKVYTIKLINNGKSDISLEQYDKNIPFGIGVKNGFIIAVDSIESNDQDLYKELHPNFKDSCRIVFNNVLIKKNKFIILRIIIIHKSNLTPQLSTLGKISNTDILYTSDEDSTTDWFKVAYVLVGIILGFIALGYILSFIVKVFEIVRTEIRKQIIKRHYDYKYDTINHPLQTLIVKIYSLVGRKRFVEILSILIDNERLDAKYIEDNEDKRAVERFNYLKETKKVVVSKDIDEVEYKSNFLKIIKILLDENVAIDDGGVISIGPSFQHEMQLALKLF
jgi:hypothetical protein